MTPTAPKPPVAPPAAPPAGSTPGAPVAPPVATPPPPPTQEQLPEPEYVPVGGEEQVTLPPNPPGEAWMAYSPEEIAQAQKELADMKPEDLLSLRNSVLALENDAKNPLYESGGIAFLELQSKTGVKINVTGRGVTTTEALVNLINGVKYAGATWGFTPIARGADLPVKRNGAPAPQGQAPSSGRNVTDSGTDVLHNIEVEAPGKDKRVVKFSVGRFQHPFNDARIRQEGGSKIIADLFDPALLWTPAHFEQMAFYNLDGQGLSVDWEKVTVTKDGKTTNYYNVLKVHA